MKMNIDKTQHFYKDEQKVRVNLFTKLLISLNMDTYSHFKIIVASLITFMP